MKGILAKCEAADFEYLDTVLDSYVSFTDDKKRKELLAQSKNDEAARTQLIELLDEQIRYYGSSDVAYLARSVWKGGGGVPAIELTSDVCEKLKITIKVGGSIETMLERLVKDVLEKEVLSKSPEELSVAFRRFGVGDAQREQILESLKTNGTALVFPLLLRILGPEATLAIVQGIIISLIAKIIGKEAAKKLMEEIVKRNPWLNSLGPVVWVISGAWLALDLQGPAFRKTVPVALYLGVVALRDGSEEDDGLVH